MFRSAAAAFIARYLIAADPAPTLSRLDVVDGLGTTVETTGPRGSFVVLDTRVSGYMHDGIYATRGEAEARAEELGEHHDVFTMAEYAREARDSSELV